MRQLLLPPLLLALSLLTCDAVAAAAKNTGPKIVTTSFGNEPPIPPIYFEDSDTLLVTSTTNLTTFRSTDGGATWTLLDGPALEEVVEVQKHPYDQKTAVVLGTNRHWITHDRGDSWKAFESDAIPSFREAGIAFHATDPKRMLFHVEECEPFCRDAVYYTTDSFNSPPKRLSDSVISCLWAKSEDIFTTGNDDMDNNRILCLAKGKLDLFGTRRRVVITDDYFDTHFEPVMSSGQTIEGVVSIKSVKKYIAFASRGERTTEMAMYVTDDTKTWHRAEFGEHRIEEGAYTLLESTNYSMQVDVMTHGGPSRSMGVLLTSNSNGTFFTKNIEHTNRGDGGYVDFEKLANIQGIVLVNVVQNWEAEEKGDSETQKKVESKISFDDGRTWSNLKVGDKNLHLHSVSEQRNTGRIFSSPAPGMVMGIGNTGDYLKAYEDGDLYISDDAGLTWTQSREKPHMYEFGAQGSVLVAIRHAETDNFQWSVDHGKNWETTKLDGKISPAMLTITPDSTSLKFLLIASKGLEYLSYSLNFEDLDMRKCKPDSKDFETWHARVDEKGEPTCIMGHKQSFKRRKADVECIVVSKDFEDPEEKREQCVCTEEDFECDYNFKKVDGKCTPTDRIVPPDGACKGDSKKYMGSSGYRLIPGNDCKLKDVDLAKEVERECKDSASPTPSGEIAVYDTPFPGDEIVEYFYLERDTSSGGNDETIIMRTNTQKIYVTHDHGKTWRQVLKGEKVEAIYPNPYNIDSVYLITSGKEVFYSIDRMKEGSVFSFTVDNEPARGPYQVLSFHPEHPDWLIWTGQRNCDSRDDNCQIVAQFSAHRGDGWETLLHGIRKCEFVYGKGRQESDELIYCEQYEDELPQNRLVLKSSTDKFVHSKDLKRDVINFAIMAEYIVVAVTDDDKKSLKVDTSIDGVTFADAKFPHNFNPDHQTAYTVLDSSTHAIFLHVTVQDKVNQEYGSIIKSNSNGTNYVLTASEVNRSPAGYVDFEKAQGIEGVAVINRVANKDEVDKGKSKKLQTYITHNDGAGWSLLGRPADPPKGKKSYDCKKGSDKQKCSLHLHGYTERDDQRHTYSSPSAVGMLMGTGNVGEYLKSFEEADTFLSRDGGLTWEFAEEGSWMWEYGDMGSIIVIVKKGKTDLVKYTLDEGRTWNTYKLSKEVKVNDITSVPSDTSRNFVLWGEVGGDAVSYNIDFTGLEQRSEPCKLDEQNPGNDDYDLWSPKHPLMADDCLFGHVSQYHRKKPDAKCYNGKELQSQLSHLHNIARNCSCTREDFECDYNYEADTTGTCRLVKGLQKSDPAAVCKENPELTEYNGITGYRRIPLTTCQGGRELDFTSVKHPCPGKEEDFNRKHGISGAGLFFAIVIPIAAAAGVGYWAWKNWDGKFGQIRLGDGGGGFGGAFDGDAPWVKYPVMAISGIVAVMAAIPMLVGSIWKAVSTRLGRRGAYARPYTSRSSFARGRGDYAVVDEDEGELLGDSDEDL